MLRRMTNFMAIHKNLGESYSPLYFLAALGNGGMAVAFFIYLNFMVPHPKTPIITFDGLVSFMTGASLLVQLLILGALGGMVFFGLRHIWLLVWNLREYALYRQTAAFAQLRESNSEVILLGVPLTLAMAVNMLFATGAAFVPGLWNIVEYLFPVAMLAFLMIGIWALRMFMDFFGRVIATAAFDCSHNNSLSQLKAVLTFGMIAVGFAAPAAMSQNRVTVTVSIIGGLFFASVAILLGLIQFILGFRSMLAHGIHHEYSVSLWTPLPILTVLGVAAIRLSRGLVFLFDIPADAANVIVLRTQANPASMLVLTTVVLGLQLLLGGLGYAVMRRVRYFETFVHGTKRSVGSYALVCPGTAVFVFGMFFMHTGLVQAGLLEKFSLPYFLMLVPFVAAQVFSIRTMLQLDEKLLRPVPTPTIDSGMAMAS